MFLWNFVTFMPYFFIIFTQLVGIKCGDGVTLYIHDGLWRSPAILLDISGIKESRRRIDCNSELAGVDVIGVAAVITRINRLDSGEAGVGVIDDDSN